MNWWEKIKEGLGEENSKPETKSDDFYKKINDAFESFMQKNFIGYTREEVNDFLIVLKRFYHPPELLTNISYIADRPTEAQASKMEDFRSSEMYGYIKDFVYKFEGIYSEQDFIQLKNSLIEKGWRPDNPNELPCIINNENKEKLYGEFKRIINSGLFGNDVFDLLRRFIFIYGIRIRTLEEIRIFGSQFVARASEVISDDEKRDELECQLDNAIKGGTIGLEALISLGSKYSGDFNCFMQECFNMSQKVSFFRRLLCENNFKLEESRNDLCDFINGSSEFFVGDLDVINLREALKNNALVNKIVLQELGLSIDKVDTISEGALLQVFNKILKMRDFHSKIDLGQYKPLISNEIQQLLSRAQIPEYSLDDKDCARLNRALLEAVYPQKTRKVFINFVIERINIDLEERRQFQINKSKMYAIYAKEHLNTIVEGLTRRLSPDYMKHEYNIELHEKIKIVKPDLYGYIQNYIGKVDKADYGRSMLKELLRKKGLILTDEELEAIVALTAEEICYKALAAFFKGSNVSSFMDVISIFVKYNQNLLDNLCDYREIVRKYGINFLRDEKEFVVDTKLIDAEGNESILYYSTIMDAEVDLEYSLFELKRYAAENKIPMVDEKGKKIDVQNLPEVFFEVLKNIKLHKFEKELTSSPKEYAIETVDSMNGFEFEKFLKLLFEKMEYKVTHTKLSGDQGADLVLDRQGDLTVVQAKRSNSRISNDAIQEVVASIRYYNAQRGMVITNNEFSKSAIELAKSNNVILLPRNELEKLINDYF